MKRLDSIAIAYGSAMIREKVGAVVREIYFHEDQKLLELRKFDAKDGSMKTVFVNLIPATYWEYTELVNQDVNP